MALVAPGEVARIIEGRQFIAMKSILAACEHVEDDRRSSDEAEHGSVARCGRARCGGRLYGGIEAARMQSVDCETHELVKRSRQPLESGAQLFRGAADSDAEMLRHFEETPRDNGCLVFLAQQLKECIGLTAR